jgi:hypothetical protein
MAQMYYYDPQSAGINVQSPQSESTPRRLTLVTIICRNDLLSSTMTSDGCLLKDSELFILFAENSQILLKISVIPILKTFIYLVALNRASLAVSPKMEATQMEIFNFLWLTWDH